MGGEPVAADSVPLSIEPVLRPLPRRPVIPLREVLPRLRRPVEEEAAALGAALVRGVQWLRFGLGLGLRVAWERRRGPIEAAQVARHLRAAIERMGGTAVKFGQQLANRVDLLPFEFCTELSLLTDRVPPFPAVQAIAAIEEALGVPLASVFAGFDPNPIGSASIACVYKAVLRTGETVAVKVQRPGIAAQFAADLAIIGSITRLLEALAIVRPGFFRFLRLEMRAMFLEELDFTLEARFQALYRRYIERDRLTWLTCPRLWRQWCGPRILVSEFVDGIPCGEVLAATETGDRAALQQLAALDIDPRQVGLNIARLGLWGFFELSFIHGDPHPANIMVLPRGRLCMLDFGACSQRSRRNVLYHRQLIQSALADRVSELADAAVTELAPLPRFDVDAFRRDLEARMLRFQCGLRDPHSPWFERTSVSLWVYLLEVTRAYALPVNPDTLRTVRATLLYDTLAFRLNPRISLGVTRRWLERAPKRLARRAERQRWRERPGDPPGVRLALRWAEFGWQLRRAEYHLDTLTLGILPGLQRLASGGARLAWWALCWVVIALGMEWLCEPGIAGWMLLGIGAAFTGLRLVRQIEEV
jgi:predicted unusual protein kinase regulating ubiquinone biosynthesis (AarF/ABC1/UbiB family)